MSPSTTPADDAELEAFLARTSSVSVEYDQIELVEPPPALDEKILTAAKLAAKSAKAPAIAKPPAVEPATTRPTKMVATPAPARAPDRAPAPAPAPAPDRPPIRTPVPTTDDDYHPAAPSRRPRWLLPAALAASVLVAVGIGLTLLDTTPSEDDAVSAVRSLFAKRARERNAEEKEAAKIAAEAAAQQEAERLARDAVVLPPPPVFEAEGPLVQDLDVAIALIRKELVLVNQMAADAEDAKAEALELAAGASSARKSTAPVPAPPPDLASPVPSAAPSVAPSIIQPRERRLTKIIELYDGGNPDLAADSLEIFLRDFEDDPISQRILGVKP